MEVVVGVHLGEATGGLVEGEPIVRELFAQLGDLSCLADNLRPCSTVADDFRTDGVVTFLPHSPVDALRMRLVVGKEELLPTIEGGAQKLISTSVEVLGMDGAVASLSPQQLGTGRVPVDHDKGGDLVATVARGDLEDVVDRSFLEVDTPPGAGVNARL